MNVKQQTNKDTVGIDLRESIDVKKEDKNKANNLVLESEDDDVNIDDMYDQYEPEKKDTNSATSAPHGETMHVE